MSLSIPGMADQASKSISPFGWQFESLPLRGGVSKGSSVQLQTTASEAWKELQKPNISEQERDRRAILAMAGSYRASFDFVETMGFSEGYQPQSPYRSWGTEVVYVLENSPQKVVLQHVLLMRSPDSEPVVVKHWRQDWQYQPSSVLRFQGSDTWRLEPVKSEQSQGLWSQTVYQVDDCPRYGGIGLWQHQSGMSVWSSDPTWRPLPRREFTVRNDYQVLDGINRHIITPTGWIHEQENNKVVLQHDRSTKVLAREFGLNRYELLENFDTQPADSYTSSTEPFWAMVRAQWETRAKVGQSYTLRSGKERGKLAGEAFQAADEVGKNGPLPNQEKRVKALVDEYFKNSREVR